MDDMRELISLAAFERGLLLAAGLWLVVSLAVGAVGHIRGKAGWGLKGAFVGLLGPLVVGLYRFYAWTVRVDPDTGYVGLHQVRVFALNALLFTAVGALAGWALHRLSRAQDRSVE